MDDGSGGLRDKRILFWVLDADWFCDKRILFAVVDDDRCCDKRILFGDLEADRCCDKRIFGKCPVALGSLCGLDLYIPLLLLLLLCF